MFPEARGAEFLIIAALALIVVGPKELPGLLRKLGQFIGKMRNIANDFRTSFDEMARQSELDDLRKQVEEMRAQTTSLGGDPTGINQALEEFNAAPMTNAPEPSAPEPVVEPIAEKPKRAPRKKPVAAAEAGTAPKKKAPAKPKRAASKDIVQ